MVGSWGWGIVALGRGSRTLTYKADPSTAVGLNIPARQEAVYCPIAKPGDEDDATNLSL
jgi:hypothetical protein